MFNNLVNIHDLLILKDKGPRLFLALFSKLIKGKQKKIEIAWAHTSSPPKNWWDIPYVRQRWNRLISGDSQIDFYKYFSRKYLPNRESLNALSLGCGSGQSELLWADTGKFSNIDAYDLSEARIKHAITVAKQKGYENLINYRVNDVYKILMCENHYDVVSVNASLHHFWPLDEILMRVNSFLKPDGYFVVDEFVGPTRFQWTNRQLQIINNLLSILPDKYKLMWGNGVIKPKVFRPSRLRMYLGDPSEAIESSKIMPFLHQIFEVVEVKSYGGTILHLLFAGIAQNFLSNDTETQRWLDICFDVEDQLLANGDIQSDFIIAICKKRLP
jgi:ubiquinone/menaquinone biosynthesis C-methylase UbiE